MIIETHADLEEALQAIADSDEIAFDTEATGLHLRHSDKSIGLSFYTPSNGKTYYIAWAHGINDQVDTDVESHKRMSAKKRRVIAFREYFEHIQPDVTAENVPVEWLDEIKRVWTPDKLYIAHNAQYDLTALYLLGFPMPERIADTMSMLSVVNPDWNGNPKEGIFPSFEMPDTRQKEHGSRGLKWQARLWGLADAKAGIDSLDEAVQAMFDRIHALNPDAAIVPVSGESTQSFLWMLKPSEVAQYAEDDVRLTYALYQKILKWAERWQDQHVHNLYNEITLAIWQMHNNGLGFNPEQALPMIQRGEARLAELAERIRTASGGMIQNAGSPKQVLAYLQAIGLDVKNSDKYTLDTISDVPIVAPLQEYRSLSISVGTFVRKWYENTVYGRIFPEYNVGGTSSGRLSSSSDKFSNGQNMPRVTAKSVVNPKMLVYPPKGHIWINIDYKSLEVGNGAWLAETVIPAILRSETAIGRWLREEILEGHPVYDQTLTGLVEDGKDMHVYAMERSGIYGILLRGRTEEQYLLDNGYNLDEIAAEGYTPEEYFLKKIARHKQKTGNFAIQYGSGRRGVMKNSGATTNEADTMLMGFHSSFPSIRQAMDVLQALAMKPRSVAGNPEHIAEYVTYPIPEIGLISKYGYYPLRQETAKGGWWYPREKVARNTYNRVTQGISGLIMLASMVRVKREFGFATWKLDMSVDYSTGLVVPLNTVHDSFGIALLPENLYIIPRIIDVLTDWDIRPRLKVSIDAAQVDGSWGSAKEVEDVSLWIESQGKEGF